MKVKKHSLDAFRAWRMRGGEEEVVVVVVSNSRSKYGSGKVVQDWCEGGELI